MNESPKSEASAYYIIISESALVEACSSSKGMVLEPMHTELVVVSMDTRSCHEDNNFEY